jgi:hypothetical protein
VQRRAGLFRQSDEAFETNAPEPLANLARCFDHLLPSHVVAGIKVHDDHVRLFEVVEPRTPGVNFENAALNETKQARQAVDGDDWFGIGVLGISGPQDFLAPALLGMLLEKALPTNPVGTRPACSVRAPGVDR